jgi:hypothetical protein
MTRVAGSVALVVLTVVLGSTDATAQSRFGFDVYGGGELSLSPAVRQHVVIEPDASVDTTAPRLADLRVRPGLVVGLRLLVGQLAVGYRMERMDWSAPVERCVGDRPAIERGDGTVDDSEVRYRCDDDRSRLGGWADDFAPIVVHAIGGDVRIDLGMPVRSRDADNDSPSGDHRAVFYLLGAASALATTWADVRHERRLRAGAELAAGAGIEIPLDRRFSMIVESRFRLGWLATPAMANDGAARAVATGRPVGQAVFDTTHRIDLTTGLRVDLR